MAIAMVLLAHAHMPHMGVGVYGVDVFFVLSGFLITTMLHKLTVASKDRAGWRLHYWTFLGRRAVRLGPAFLVALAASTCWAILSGIPRVAECSALAASYTMNLPIFSSGSCVGPFHFAWSLAAEEQFYLVWPLLVIGLVRMRTRLAGLVCLAGYAACVAAAQGAYYLDHNSAGWLNFYPGGRSAGLLLGAAVAFALVDGGATRAAQASERGRELLEAITRPLVHFALPTLLAGSVLVAYFEAQEHGPPQVLLGPLVAVPTALLLVVISRRSRATTRLLSRRSLVWLGEISYSLYLVHMLALYILRQVRHDDSITTNLLAMALAVTTAAVLNRYIEAPLRRSGYKAVAELERRAVTTKAAERGNDRDAAVEDRELSRV